MLSFFSTHYALYLCISLCVIPSAWSVGFSFNGFKQYRLIPMSIEAVDKIRWLNQEFPPEPNVNTGLTFLTMPGQKFESVDLLVPPALEPAFLTAVRSTGAMRVRLVHRSYGRMLAEFDRDNTRSRLIATRSGRQRRQSENAPLTSGLILRHNFYRKFTEICEDLIQLNERCNELVPGTCQLKTIGKTHENKDLIVLRIAKKVPGNKTKIWIDGGIHAREWISHATVMYFADKLISDLTSNTSHTASILNNHDIMVLPMYNPDGYEYSRRHNRMWRKNREPTHHRACRGVDLNRNYGHLWGGNASVAYPCASNYRGIGAFSAKETAAVRQFVESEKTNLIMFMSFHSYGQYILTPFGYKRSTYSTTHKEKMLCAANAAIYTMFAINNRFYTYGTGSDLLYEANGGSDDWAHGAAKIPYSYTFELPDNGDYGFLLPASQVPGVGREVTRGLRALLEAIRRLEAGKSATDEEICGSLPRAEIAEAEA